MQNGMGITKPNAKSGNYDFRLLCKIFCEIPNIKGMEKDVS